MDIYDAATAQEEMQRERAIAQARQIDTRLPAVGKCYNCLASVPPGARFCDADCRDDYQTRRNAEVRRGRGAE